MTGAISEGQMMGDDGTPQVERFQATSGRVTGWLSVAVAAVIVAAGIAYRDQGFPAAVVAGAVLAAVLAWASMLRPALWVRDGEVLVMRNMLETVQLRLAAVEELALRQVLAVRVADRRWVSPVVGRSWRKSMTSGRGPAASDPAKVAAAAVSYPDFVEERLRLLVEDARTSAGVRPGSPEQLALPDAVRREPAWAAIALVLAALVALVVTLLL
jgi:hypothetical protein